MKEPFSIVIPVHNREDVVERTLCSVEAQTYRPLQLLLVDNNSTDGTLPLLRRWTKEHGAPDFHVEVLEEKTPGAAAARNCGLRQVRTRFMLFFDSDDELYPHAVQAYMDAFLSPEQPELVLAPSEREDLQGKRHFVGTRGGNRMLEHFHHGTLRTQGFAATTDLVRRAGAWNESTRIWDDWELGIRLLLQEPRTVALKKPVCLIHTSQECISGTEYWQKARLYDVPMNTAAHVLAGSTFPGTPRLVEMMRYRRAMLAAHFRREGHPELAAPMLAKALDGASPRRRLLLRVAYAYIRRGGRGFDRIINAFF